MIMICYYNFPDQNGELDSIITINYHHIIIVKDIFIELNRQGLMSWCHMTKTTEPIWKRWAFPGTSSQSYLHRKYSKWWAFCHCRWYEHDCHSYNLQSIILITIFLRNEKFSITELGDDTVQILTQTSDFQSSLSILTINQ